jgi:hypothetical protein
MTAHQALHLALIVLFWAMVYLEKREETHWNGKTSSL